MRPEFSEETVERLNDAVRRHVDVPPEARSVEANVATLLDTAVELSDDTAEAAETAIQQSDRVDTEPAELSDEQLVATLAKLLRRRQRYESVQNTSVNVSNR